MTREENIEQLSKALTYYREHPPDIDTRANVDRIARRFAVSPRALWQLVGLWNRFEAGELTLDDGECDNGN